MARGLATHVRPFVGRIFLVWVARVPPSEYIADIKKLEASLSAVARRVVLMRYHYMGCAPHNSSLEDMWAPHNATLDAEVVESCWNEHSGWLFQQVSVNDALRVVSVASPPPLPLFPLRLASPPRVVVRVTVTSRHVRALSITGGRSSIKSR